jgi:hypothetical protein
MEEKQIIYPITLEYRKHWNEWEAIRELIQNALDSDKETTRIYKQDENLIIEDKGKGLQVKHLLLGISEKQDKENARGQFGEGLKIALIVLKRLGYNVEIISNNLHCTVDTVDIEGEKCLKINYEHNGLTFNGTKIIIHNYKGQTYEDKFIMNGNKTILFHDAFWGDIIEKPNSNIDGELYVKDIYVTKIKNSEFSYNLKKIDLEESRNIPNEYTVKRNIANVWASCNNKTLWIRMFKAMEQNRYERQADFEFIYFSNNVEKIIKETFKELYPNHVVKTSDVLAKECIWRNKEVIDWLDPNTHGDLIKLLPTDKQFLEEYSKGQDIEVNEETLSITEKKNLEIARKIAKMVNPNYNVKVYIMGNNEVLGKAYNPIRINRKIMDNTEQVISTTLHELTHLFYGIGDMTVEQIHRLTDLAAIPIIKLLIQIEKEYDFETTLLECKVKDYTQYKISIPKKLIQEKGLKKSDKIKVKIQ